MLVELIDEVISPLLLEIDAVEEYREEELSPPFVVTEIDSRLLLKELAVESAEVSTFVDEKLVAIVGIEALDPEDTGVIVAVEGSVLVIVVKVKELVNSELLLVEIRLTPLLEIATLLDDKDAEVSVIGLVVKELNTEAAELVN